MHNILEKSVDNIKGVGKKNLELLNDLNIYTIKDILFNIPYRVNLTTDFSNNSKDNEKVVTKGIIENNVVVNFYARRKSRSYFSLQTELGSIKIVYFNQNYLKKHLKIGKTVYIKGVYNKNTNVIVASNISFTNFKDESDDTNIIEVFYHTKQGLSQKTYKKIVKNCFDMLDKETNFIDLVPKNFKGIWELKKILYTMHFPENNEIFEKAKKMFAFHELFNYQLKLQLQNLKDKVEDDNYKIEIEKKDLEFFEDKLEFKFTNSQKKAIEEIVYDLKQPHKMDRLLQGDVGCGKTVVAAITMFSSIKKGVQCAIMAPTEILAMQHFDTFFEYFKNLDISIALLTSGTPKKERIKILEYLKNGEIDIIVGTHALIQKDVIYKNLKYVITDEQHRFGVNQRRELAKKGEYVNHLMMTATPIPRSLAITLITDIKLSTIDELPSGRKKVQTIKATHRQLDKVFENLKRELVSGRQGYVVCPLIEESEKMDLKNVLEIYEKINTYFNGEYKVEFLHGKMSNIQKEEVVNKFLNNEIQILVSTTVVEVGVNVKNATFMVVIDAERFGLATLHQLRGRVGRSLYQSYCILVTDKKSERIDIMCLENDGFKIAEFDLKNRGSGDFFGTKQSGVPSFKVADLVNDVDLMYLAKKLATNLIKVSDLKKLCDYVGLEETII